MAALPKVGRFMFAIPMAVFGMLHFMNAGMMAGMVPGFVTAGVPWVYLTGIALIAAAAAIAFNKHASLAAQLLGVMLVIFALTIHLVGVMGAADDMAMAASMAALLKDTALAGGAFVLSGALSGGGSAEA
jgi:uncharacterized membrane protein